MPSSSFVVNSEFQPMSYQELLHPVITQTQYQRELDEKYTQLDLQADKLEQLANSAVDAESYAKYKNFANKLRQEADNLSKYGLRGRDNARFMELFRSYGKEIQPLLDAQAKRERLIEQQRQLSMQDPTSLYDRSAGNISLQELMANPSAAPIRQSGDLLMKQSAAIAQNLAKEIREAVFTKTNTPGYLAFKQKYGLSSSEIAAFASDPNSPNANRVLKAIYDQVMTSSGVKENWEGDAYNKASQYVAMGLWNAIGAQQIQPLTDVYGMEQLRAANEMARLRASIAGQERLQNLKYAQQKQLLGMKNGATGEDLNVNITSNMTPKERTKFNEQSEDLIKRGFLTKNGDLTEKGIRELDKLRTSKGVAVQTAYGTGRIQDMYYYAKYGPNKEYYQNEVKNFERSLAMTPDYKFAKYVRTYIFKDEGFKVRIGKNGKSNGIEIYNKDGEMMSRNEFKNIYGSNNIGSIFRNRYKSLMNDGVDLTKTNAYSIDIGDSAGKHYAQKMASGKNKIDVIDSEGNKKTINTSDLYGDKMHSNGRLVVSPASNEFYIDVNIDGEAYKIPVQRSIIGNVPYNNVMDMAKKLDMAGNWMNKGIKPAVDKDGNIDWSKVNGDGYWDLNDQNQVVGAYQFGRSIENYMNEFGKYVGRTASGVNVEPTKLKYADESYYNDLYETGIDFDD